MVNIFTVWENRCEIPQTLVVESGLLYNKGLQIHSIKFHCGLKHILFVPYHIAYRLEEFLWGKLILLVKIREHGPDKRTIDLLKLDLLGEDLLFQGDVAETIDKNKHFISFWEGLCPCHMVGVYRKSHRVILTVWIAQYPKKRIYLLSVQIVNTFAIVSNLYSYLQFEHVCEVAHTLQPTVSKKLSGLFPIRSLFLLNPLMFEVWRNLN
jgi:hypothetical protein